MHACAWLSGHACSRVAVGDEDVRGKLISRLLPSLPGDGVLPRGRERQMRTHIITVRGNFFFFFFFFLEIPVFYLRVYVSLNMYGHACVFFRDMKMALRGRCKGKKMRSKYSQKRWAWVCGRRRAKYPRELVTLTAL